MYKLLNILRRTKFAREAGEVRRCHTMRIIGEYNVAQHSFNMVTMLLAFHPEASSELIKACLYHDLPERLTGDIPATAKWANIVSAEILERNEKAILKGVGCSYMLTVDETKWLRSMDIFELYLFCLDQHMLGNKDILVMTERIEKTILEKSNLYVREIVDIISKKEQVLDMWKRLPELNEPSYFDDDFKLVKATEKGYDNETM